ncbi:MAG: phosphodiester glycosidase family protein [bacterium]|nr:phosphodiester glycosidase family protein [bacterium]
MKKIWRETLLTLLIQALCLSGSSVMAQDQSSSAVNTWQQVEPGLEFGEFLAPQLSEAGDSLVRILRIDPDYFELRLMNASASTSHNRLSAKGWCRRYDLVAAINAGMYQTDYRTSVSLMRSKTHVNNSRVTRDKTILAFDPQTSNVQRVKIIDRQCENFDEWQGRYGSFVQSIRMISCKGRNVWRRQPDKKWSTAVIATDRDDKVLFIHVRSIYNTHDLIDILQQLPLNINRAMYVEGGREAQLYIHNGQFERELVGSHGSSAFNPYNSARPLPNVIGITRRGN